MEGGRADQHHRTGVVQRLLEQGGSTVQVTLFVLDVARIEASLGKGEAFQVATVDLGFKFREGVVLIVGVEHGHARTQKFGLFGGGGLAGIPQLDHARHYGENDHQGHYDLASMTDKKFLDFRVVRICFVSHNMHPF